MPEQPVGLGLQHEEEEITRLQLSHRPVNTEGGNTRHFSEKFIECMTDPVVRERNRRLADLVNHNLEGRNLTRRQKLFVSELLSDPNRNGYEAARKAGYAESGAAESARFLLKDARIRKLIEEADREVFAKYDISHERVLQEVAAIAFSNIFYFMQPKKDVNGNDTGEFDINFEKTPTQMGAAVQEYTVEDLPNGTKRTRIKLYDKQVALDKLAKYLGNIFPDRLALGTTPGSGPVTINIIDQVIAEVRSLTTSQTPARILEGESA